jgi:FAD:protein FMN transferase
MKKFNYAIALCILFMISACSENNAKTKAQELHLKGFTMGTTYNIKVIVKPKVEGVATDKVTAYKAFNEQKTQADIDNLLRQLNDEMSTYIPESELSIFNKSTSLNDVEISDGLQRVIAEALRLGELSGGKLDISVGPLVNLWGFGPEFKPEVVPDSAKIAATRARTGLDKLKLNGNKLSKTIPNLYVDLSTIAKGYGVDLVAEYLESNGINDYLVEIGGEMRIKGFKHTGALWHIAIEKPITKERTVQQVIVPRDNAVATSGDYRNYIEVEGQRYSHIIDPATGKPINHKLVSVTVIHPSSMTADGLSTALMVMGEEQAMAFATKHGIAAYIISKTEDGFKEQITVKFMPYLK